MANNLLSPLLLLLPLFLLHHANSASVQSPAPAPEPAGPPDIDSILRKAGHFNKLAKLLKRTRMDERIESLLNNSHSLTVFAPSDMAFQKLSSEAIKSMSYQQRIQLLQFHVINNYLSYNDFQTVTNPLSTQAGDNKGYMYPMNITVSGEQQVNITTGKVNATVENQVYNDERNHLLVVYEVDRVLLPMGFYVHPPPSPPPPPEKPEKAAVAPADPEEDTKSGAVKGMRSEFGVVWVVGCVVAAFSL
ncbi:hypothetical protein NMG60_11000522 [Bertholletia excelsa]